MVNDNCCSLILPIFFVFQREEGLLNDLDVTGQAFEDMQEQNTRLLQQLREKDDANFKLMSEVSLYFLLTVMGGSASQVASLVRK